MSYLPYNRKWKLQGRVLKKDVQGPHLILRLHNNQEMRLLYREEYESIQVYDWVAVDEKDQLQRVTPSGREPRWPKVDVATLRKWSAFQFHLRAFFEHKGFLELQTPTLVECPGTEPTLEVFQTELKIGSKTFVKFLPTSPELHLKKSLCMGFDKIFEIAKCYRNGEVTELHQPEFWMLEWYRSFANLLDIQVDCVELIHYLADRLQVPRPIDIECVSIRSLFKKHLSFDLRPDTSLQQYQELAVKSGIVVREAHTIDDLFFLLMLEKIEPQLPQDKLIFVEKYPPFQAALARRDHEGWAERFEIYWKGMELANAFDELNDPVEQRLRAQEDLIKREGRSPIQLDEDFFQALESGMPPSAGIAMGTERLFMALAGINQIQKIRLF